jgi:hypothetical protein
MRRNSKEGKVIFNARVRVAGLTVFDISHKISSTRTAERAIFVEKVILARVCDLNRLLNIEDLSCKVNPAN